MSKPSAHRCNFTPRQIQRMLDMWLDGMRQHEIAKIFGVSKNTIAIYLRAARGEDPKPKPDGPGDGPMPLSATVPT